MTTDRTARLRRMASLRTPLYIPLAVGVLAGAVGAGTGVGAAGPVTADPDAVTASTHSASTSTEDTAPGSAGDTHWWSLYNYTGQSVYGEWSVQSGESVSETKTVKDWPLPSGSHESRGRNDSMLWKTYWMGHICYNHAWYNFPRTHISMGDDATFVLWNAFTPEAESGGSENVPSGVRVSWNPADPRDPAKADLIRNPYEAPC
ncbi:hypothetical protein R3Q06_34445 [Rhodococcus erythropolis]|uniref:hypothetical protein n=1 Tax=Rhodococcus erythropolis TaxID=1833 RepID=UPI002949D28E|nr:hypothetical protein [Rhodococcus erythropolis]MDV6278505.1 hypothetical protein [Rhodococcus erythropolis]